MTRYLLYSHDTYGLGHLRRSTLLAEAIVQRSQDNEVLIVTGSPQAQAFALPDRVDSLKLPSATKDGAGVYRPRRLGGSIRDLVALRSAIVTAAVGAYAPDVVVVDHAPVGMAGELVAMLERGGSGEPGPRMVLGLRDIIDDADKVEADWQRAGVWRWLERYDDVLVYGDARLLTTACELGLDRRLDATVTHTGYVAPVMPSPVDDVEPYLLVTPGGGGDGQLLLRRHLDAVSAGATKGLRSIIVTGPLMSSSRRDELLERARRSPSIEILEFTDRMRSLIASAAGVISMAGYNTVVEELAAGVPALLVPRCRPRREQDIRARRLAPHTNLSRCSIGDLDTAAVAQFVADLERPGSSVARPLLVDLGGARTAAAALEHPSCSAPPTHPQSHPRSLSLPQPLPHPNRMEQCHDDRLPTLLV